MIKDLTEIAESTDLVDGTIAVAREGPRSPSGVLDGACVKRRRLG